MTIALVGLLILSLAYRAGVGVDVMVVFLALLALLVAVSWRKEKSRSSMPNDSLADSDGDIIEELKAKTAYLEELIESAPDGIVVLDSQDRVQRINASFTKIFGFLPEDIVGKELTKLIVPPDQTDRALALSHTVSDGESIRCEGVRLRKDGRPVPVFIIGTPVKIDGGQIGVYGIYRDLTEQKEAEEQLVESEQKFRHFIDGADDIIYQTDALGRFTYVNAKALEVTGRSVEEILGRRYLEIVAPSYRDAVAAEYEQQAQSRTANTYFEFPIESADGSQIWIGQNVRLVIRNGRICNFQAVARDITMRLLMEEKLHESEQKFQSILNTIRDVIWSVSPQDNRLLYLSPSAEELLGVPLNELIKAPFKLSDFVHPDDGEAFQSWMADLRTNGSAELEIRIQRPDGGVRWTSGRLQLVRNESGKPVRQDGILHDITARKKAEDQLTAREKYYRALLDNSLDIVVVLNLDATVSYNSPSMDKLLGLEPNAMVGRNAMTLVHPEDQAFAMAALAEAIANPGTTQSVEIRVWHADGNWRTLQTKGMCVAGDQPYVVINASDITELKSAEAKISQLSRAVEQSPVSVVITDPSGRIEYVNPWFQQLTGYPIDEAIGKKPSILQSGQTPRQVYEELWNTITRGGTWRGEFCNRKKNGETYWESSTISPVRDSNGVICSYIAVKEDISKRKSAERALIEARETAESATKAKAEFLATMSHEIRTPMNGIVGMTDLLLETDLSSEQRDYVETIRVSNDALLAVINDILDFSKIESGRIELERLPFELSEVLESTLSIFSQKAAEKNIELLCHVDPSIPDVVMGDSLRLRQVLMNLVGNALKFTDEGEVGISVWPVHMNHVADSEKISLLFEVKDTGIGISADKMDRLFKPFYQVDSSTTRKYGGTGLGLAISEKIVGIMGGSFHVESVEGQGSSFSFQISLETAPSHHRLQVPRELKGKRVLVVDDNSTNRKILATQLGLWGMEVYSTGLPAEALARIHEGVPFDLAIVDMHMPEMDGLTLGIGIRAARTAEQLPMILLSSGSVDDAIRENSPFGEWMLKPAKKSQLLDAVCRRILSHSSKKNEDLDHLEVNACPIRPLRILLAEDNPINQKVAVRMFERMGYRIDVVADGMEAVKAARANAYHLIFMDMQMPRMDGVEATRQIRQSESVSNKAAIIAMTANATEEDRQACYRAGMDDFITKPFQIAKIKSKLTNWEGRTMDVQSTQPSGSPIVRSDHLYDLGLFGDSLKELTSMFLEQTPQLIHEIKSNASFGELTGFRARVHELKGASANMGAVAMVAACDDLLRINGRERPKEINVLIHRLGLVFEETRYQLEQIVRSENRMVPGEAA